MVLFSVAADEYVKSGGSHRYLKPIVAYFDGVQVEDISPADIRQMVSTIYPTHANSTRNRHGITPARAVLYYAHYVGWRNPIKIRMFKEERSTLHKPVNTRWLEDFLARCDKDGLPHLAAIVLFMNHTAARISEAVQLEPRHIDLRRREALLIRTKTDTMAKAHLTDELVERLQDLPVFPNGKLFGYTSRFSVAERMRAVCERAKIIYRPPHSVGRHSFATNALNMGVGVKTAMEAGRWKSSVVFLETYAHTARAGRTVADRINHERYMNGLVT